MTRLFVAALLLSLTACHNPPPQIAGELTAVTELVFTEGPACHPDGSVYYTDIANNRIMKLESGATIAETFVQPSHKANGLAFDARNQLIVCEGNERGGAGGRRITRIDPETGERAVIVDNYRGKKFNSPNDLCIDALGRIYFTDPYYGPFREGLELDEEAVYRVNPDGSGLVRVIGAPDIARPNGIAITPDRKKLYVVDNEPNLPVRKLWVFGLGSDGLPTGEKYELHDFGKGRGGDGMCLDAEGNIYVAGGADRKYPNQTTDNPGGAYVFHPTGQLLGIIRVPEDMVTNCTFGGPDRKTLYITAGKTLWSVPMRIPGATP
ncbi:MAG: SMP-30/gluconolactonase/LRE family protein [Planctomycetota bacterium]|jgi:gluconolactonase